MKCVLIIHALLLVPLSVVRAADSPKSAAPRPDILLIMPDQMRGDCLSIVGHPVVRTPNLDKLAEAGVLFRRGYTPVPSCIPARYALLTGMSPQASGVVGFKSHLMTTPTLPAVMAEAGYSTVLVGRNMHQNPPNKSLGYQREILGSTYVSNDAYDQYLRKAAPESGGIARLIRKTGVTTNWWQANPWPLDDDLHPTAWTAREAEKVVEATPADKPLFLTASFYAPHSPLFPPKKYFDALLAKEMPKPAHGDWVNWADLSPKGNKEGDRILLEGEQLHRTQAGYFGLIEQIDDQIAPLIAAFQARSEKAGRPWVIVMTADHGEMLGDNGYYRKCEPYEGDANIPFIITGSPALQFKPGIRKDQLVALQDIMPTLVALAGATPPSAMDGINLLPVLRGDEHPVRDILHVEHAPCYSEIQAFHFLTDAHWKYIWRPATGAEQLFNLDNDPREEHDLSTIASSAVTLEQWRQRLIRQLAGRPEGFSDGKQLIKGRPYPPIQHERSTGSGELLIPVN